MHKSILSHQNSCSVIDVTLTLVLIRYDRIADYASYDTGVSARTDHASSRRCRFQKSIAKGPHRGKRVKTGKLGKAVRIRANADGESFEPPAARHKAPGTRHHDTSTC